MKIIVLDLEMNQPSRKIIQIGAVIGDLKRGLILDKFDFICNPGELPSPEITTLTGISADSVANGIPLKVALETFWKWAEDHKCGMQLGAWGSDVWGIIQASKEEGISGFKHPDNLNIKELAKVFRTCLPNSKKSGGLVNTMEAFDLEFEGQKHNAYWDAYNTMKLLFVFQKLISKSLRIQSILKED